MSELPVNGSASFGRRSTQWEECDRCGFTYPIAQMRLQSGDGGGWKVCPRCFDEPSVNDLRPDELPREAPLLFVDEGGPNQ